MTAGKIRAGKIRAGKIRADRLLVERGHFPSRAKAQEAIAAGLVHADGIPVRKPSETIAADARIDAQPAHAYVSRGGSKLAAALDHFGFDPTGAVCLDVGASTGGFTDVLLRRGARLVYAVDVGRGQLDPALARHPKIVSIEATDIRRLSAEHFPEPAEIIVVDVSFISLRLVLPPAVALGSPSARLVALVKPQFEAGRHAVKKGIVRDAATHEAVCADIAAHVAALGFTVRGCIPSPLLGGDGNREFLLGATRGDA